MITTPIKPFISLLTLTILFATGASGSLLVEDTNFQISTALFEPSTFDIGLVKAYDVDVLNVDGANRNGGTIVVLGVRDSANPDIEQIVFATVRDIFSWVQLRVDADSNLEIIDSAMAFDSGQIVIGRNIIPEPGVDLPIFVFPAGLLWRHLKRQKQSRV